MLQHGHAPEVNLDKIINADFANERVQYNKKNVYDFKLDQTKDVNCIIEKIRQGFRC